MASIKDVNIIKTDKEEYIEVPFTEYFHNINETSYKRWSLKDTSQNWNSGAWKIHDLIFNLYSTGKTSLSSKISVNSGVVALSWRVELLDQNSNEIATINFASIVLNNRKKSKARKIQFEKRVRNIDLDLISRVSTVRIYSE